MASIGGILKGAGGAAKKVGGVLKYTSGIGPAIGLATSGGKSASLPGPLGGSSKLPVPGVKKGKAPAGAGGTGDLASQLSSFSQYLPEGYDIEGALKFNEWKKANPENASLMEELGITPNFIKKPDAEGPGMGYNPLEAQSIFTDILQPHLAKITEQRNSIADQYTAAMGSILGKNQLPPEYAGVLAAQVPQQAQQMKQQALGAEQLGMQAPALDMLVNQLKQSQQEAAKAYYAQLAASQGGGAGADTGGLSF